MQSEQRKWHRSSYYTDWSFDTTLIGYILYTKYHWLFFVVCGWAILVSWLVTWWKSHNCRVNIQFLWNYWNYFVSISLYSLPCYFLRHINSHSVFFVTHTLYDILYVEIRCTFIYLSPGPVFFHDHKVMKICKINGQILFSLSPFSTSLRLMMWRGKISTMLRHQHVPSGHPRTPYSLLNPYVLICLRVKQ